jgi:hypothetical protein
MGAFNSLDVTIACPSCQETASREIQFRYGAVWQYRYHLGDVLRWGRNDVGDPDAPDVVVDAWLCECQSCDHDGRIALYVRHNTLATVGSVDDVPLLAELEWRPLLRDGSDEAHPASGSTAKRLAEQRGRNRLMDALAPLAACDEGVRGGGDELWQAAISSWVDDAAPWAWTSWSVFNAAEAELLKDVQTIIMVSRHEIAGLRPSDLLASNWALRIRELAAPALHVMNARGRFSDEDAETEPSGPRVDLHDADHAPVAEVEIPFGTVVESTVVCHHQFGMGVWVAGEDQFGHVNVPAIRDGKIRSVEDFPPIGARVRAVVLGYSGSRQLRLSTRPSDLPGLTERGKALLWQIAATVGAGEVDVDDEHDRWRVYWDAVPHEDLRVLLKEIAGEGEELSRQIVIEALKYVDETEGRSWVDLLPQSQGRDFAERRLREWVLIREVVERPRRIADDLPDLTPWCQRRLIERVASDVVLSDLAEHGSSKKIRHAAGERRAGRWKGWA